jgi:hypothetical protein
MKAVSVIVLALVVLVLLAGCAPGVNTLRGTADGKGVIAGFWRGLWNGIISPITFIISLFNPAVQMYEVHNNGGWYNFGFLFGVMVIFGGGAGGSQARRRRG